MSNIFSDIPRDVPTELFEDIIKTEKLRVERIVSKGQASPENFWYDQDENEWVIVLSGYGVIEFKTSDTVTLKPGDYLNIKAHEQHRVQATAADETTVWLAIFY